jgi:folate-binding protein YgfZ
VSDDSVLDRLRAGRGVIDLSHWRKVAVGGSEALTWLDALVSADLGDLAPGRAVRSLLLSATGRVRAEFTVTAPGGTVVLIQDPDQRPIQDLLAPYVLSSDVELEDRAGALSLFAMPGRTTPPDVPGAAYSVPSCLGPGVDLITLGEDHDSHLARLSKTLTPVPPEDLEVWRVLEGRPRLGVDVRDDDLPQEGGLADAVAFDKGCFTGQEAVAKVRNLGHPRRLLVQLEGIEPLAPGDRVLAQGVDAGEVTSVAARDGLWVALARVPWSSRGGRFSTAGGAALEVTRTL